MKNSKMTLQQVFGEFLKMSYFKNAAAASGALHTHANHEDALKEVLVKGGFVAWTPAKSLKKKNATSSTFAEDMPAGSFVEQPFGSQSAPDFFVKTWNNRMVPLEAKSSATYAPTYNSGGVKADYFYVFCSQKTNKTTIFKGDSIIHAQQQEVLDNYIAEEKSRVDVLNEKLKALDVTGRGISYYARPMICQSGGAKLTNYFTHEKRNQTEQHTLDVIKEIESE
jgi:hypothetical protein